MDFRDLLITPIVIALVYLVAYMIRPWVTDPINKRYFMTALTIRIAGALALGLVYQFYYHGGDTYNFHTHGSRHIWEAFWDSPDKGFKLLFSDGSSEAGIYKYSSRIPFFRDPSSYSIIRIAAFFDLFTFSAYSATAIFFSVASFGGSWCLFLAFYEERKHCHREIAIATLFIPSVCFWGSGILKDTITLAALGTGTFIIKKIFIQHRWGFFKIFFLLLSLYLLFSIKKYILLCFFPALIVWFLLGNLKGIRSPVLKLLLIPVTMSLAIVAGYFSIIQVGASDQRYNVNSLGQTAMVTAYDIAFQTGRDAGSTYSLGELDGSLTSLLKLAPQAINVSLFRPYLWEVKNPLMLVSSLESNILFVLTLYVLIRCRKTLAKALSDPNVVFCLIFSLTFAFAVGVSTFNFGTLSRYKIPLLPFYLLALIFIYDDWKRERNVGAFDATEN
jgi:hypothetical protein